MCGVRSCILALIADISYLFNVLYFTHSWLFVWMIVLALTVIFQRRKKEASRMSDKWEEMKKEDERRAAGTSAAQWSGT